MDDDDYMADMLAAYTAAELIEDDGIEDDGPDYAEHEYWDKFLAEEYLDDLYGEED